MIQTGDTVYYRTRVKGRVFTILGEVLSVDYTCSWATIKRLNGRKRGRTENVKLKKLVVKEEV